jgi:hypothetical protein
MVVLGGGRRSSAADSDVVNQHVGRARVGERFVPRSRSDSKARTFRLSRSRDQSGIGHADGLAGELASAFGRGLVSTAGLAVTYFGLWWLLRRSFRRS